MRKKRLGQSTLEYAIIIAVVVGALLTIQVYMKRGVQGKLRESSDKIGEQYSAGYMTSKYSTSQDRDMVTNETMGLDEAGREAPGVSYYKVEEPAKITRETSAPETTTKTLEEEPLFPSPK